MAGPTHDDNTHNGYDNDASSGGDHATNKRRRRTPATITDVRVARIETVTMTPDEKREAIQAWAVLIARYWREHPDQAA
jgi:hypothetical protein